MGVLGFRQEFRTFLVALHVFFRFEELANELIILRRKLLDRAVLFFVVVFAHS